MLEVIRIRIVLISLTIAGIAGCSAEVGDMTASAEAAGQKEPGIAISPKNAQIQFVGTHTGNEPKPRTGVFREFEGTCRVHPESKRLQSISVVIRTNSLQTKHAKLNAHLKTADFFDTREYPTAKFASTSIEPVEGKATEFLITGNLTLLETTKEISFPATIARKNGSLTLHADFTIDRTAFGMNKLQDGVEKEVQLEIEIGKKTVAPQAG